MPAERAIRFQEPAPRPENEGDEAKSGPRVKRKNTEFVHVQIVPGDGEEPVEPGRGPDHSSGDEEQARAFEEESRVARMSAASKKRTLRELRHNDLETATIQLVQLAQKNTKVLPVDLPSEASRGLLERLGGFCLAVCLPAPKRNLKGGGKRKSAYDSGFLWKLNSEVQVEDTPKMANLKSWRRRLFFVLEPRDHLGDVAVVYISEKRNGQVHLVALLSFQGVSRSSVEELPALTMSTSGRDTMYSSMAAVKQYDVALLAPGGLASDEDYEVPTEFFPFAITWQDATGAEKKSVLAGATAEERQKWTLVIRTILARMQSPPSIPENSHDLPQSSARPISS